jgi:signal transduction histidine kinase
LDDSGKVLQMVAQKDLTEAAAKRLAQIDIEGNMRSGWIVRNNEPLFIPRMSADARAVDLAKSSELETYAAVPIVAHDQVLGVLTILSDAIAPYPVQEEMELLTSVGEQLGIVVENARLQMRADQLLVLQERNRLARELHDSVTQSLYSVTLFAEAGLNLTQSGADERVARLFSDVLETGQLALKEMRLLLHNLRPSVLAKEGLVRALEHRLNAVEGRAGIKQQLIVEGALDLPPTVEEALYLVAQEALNNALNHARADSVRVHLMQDNADTVVLIVQDDGQGFDVETAAGSGLGLTTMRERVEQLGGEIAYFSQIGQGTEVRARLPVYSARGI